jgi:hypothetical protein
MKPVSASDILRKTVPRKFLGQSSVTHQNRYDLLREPSPAPSGRERLYSSASQKRKEYDSDSACEEVSQKAKASRLDDECVEEIVMLESKISKVSTMCGRMVTDLQKLEGIEDPLRLLLAEMAETIRMTNEVQEELAGKLKRNLLSGTHSGKQHGPLRNIFSHEDFPEITVSNVGEKGKTVNPRSRPKGGLVPFQDDRWNNHTSKVNSKPAETEEEIKKRKFGEAIRDAERSTLCFNLDMGNVPIMNKGTISEKASIALTKMAATKEGKGSAVPSNDAITVIDDVISLVTSSMELPPSSIKVRILPASALCLSGTSSKIRIREYMLRKPFVMSVL